MDSATVQEFINNNIGKNIEVMFRKKDGTISLYQGIIPEDTVRSESVAFLTPEGYKRFNINNVIEIKNV